MDHHESKYIKKGWLTREEATRLLRDSARQLVQKAASHLKKYDPKTLLRVVWTSTQRELLADQEFQFGDGEAESVGEWGLKACCKI